MTNAPLIQSLARPVYAALVSENVIAILGSLTGNGQSQLVDTSGRHGQLSL